LHTVKKVPLNPYLSRIGFAKIYWLFKLSSNARTTSFLGVVTDVFVLMLLVALFLLMVAEPLEIRGPLLAVRLLVLFFMDKAF
jgi:hypothetical protein